MPVSLGGLAVKFLAPILIKNLIGRSNPMGNLQPGEQQVMPQGAKDEALIRVKNKKGSVIVILGTRDTGKTELSYRLAEFLERPTYAVSPQQKPPGWIEHIKMEDVFTRVKPMSTLIMDDLPAYASNRDYNDGLIQTMEKMIPMVRHEPSPPEHPVGMVHLIFCSQTSAQADKYILDCDLAFLKPLGLLYADLERQNIKRLYDQLVNPYFDGQPDSFIVRHAYMISRQYKGLIEFSRAQRYKSW